MSALLPDGGAAAGVSGEVKALVEAVRGCEPFRVGMAAVAIDADATRWDHAATQLTHVRRQVRDQGGRATRPAIARGLAALIDRTGRHSSELLVVRRSVTSLATALARAQEVATEVSVEPTEEGRLRAKHELDSLTAVCTAVVDELTGLFQSEPLRTSGGSAGGVSGGGGAVGGGAGFGPSVGVGRRSASAPPFGSADPLNGLRRAMEEQYRTAVIARDWTDRGDRDWTTADWTDRDPTEPAGPGSGGPGSAASGEDTLAAIGVNDDGWSATAADRSSGGGGRGAPGWLPGWFGEGSGGSTSRAEAGDTDATRSQHSSLPLAAGGVGALGAGAAMSRARSAGAFAPMVPGTPGQGTADRPRAEAVARGTRDEWVDDSVPMAGWWS